MNREAELALVERCLVNYRNGTTTSGPQSTSDSERYIATGRFSLEMEKVLKRLPTPLAHASELAQDNAFRTVPSSLGELVLTRDDNGQVHAFHNSCRHRGTRLLAESSGCARRLTCPYHAWSYSTDGKLASVPDEQQCFPSLDRTKLGLLEVPAVEKYGFVWICPSAGGPEDGEKVLDNHLGDMGDSLAWLGLERLYRYTAIRRTWHANWKLLTEGGLETYHFAVAHRGSLAPYFMKNLAVTDAIGRHFRVAMPHRQIESTGRLPPAQRHLRDCTHTLFSLMSTDALLLQKEHIDWIKFRPLAPDRTEITITSLVPHEPDKLTAEQEAHWQRNMEITDAVLTEDFELGEGIQRSLDCGAIAEINYGCNEWALKAFNENLDRLCGLPGDTSGK